MKQKQIVYYNDEQKQRFLAVLNDNGKETSGVRNAFFLTITSETLLQKDVSTFNYDELMSTIKSMKITRVSQLRKILSSLRLYLDWCIVSGLTHYSENPVDSLKAVPAWTLLCGFDCKTFSSPEDVKAFLDRVYRPFDELTVDNMYRAIFWLSYIGIEPDKLSLVKTRDINFKTRTINFEAQTLKIPDYAYDDLYRFSQQVIFYIPTVQSFTGMRKSTRINSPYFLVTYATKSTKSITASILHTGITYRANEQVQKTVSPTLVFLSGFYYRVYEFEQQNERLPDAQEFKWLYAQGGVGTALPHTALAQEYLGWRNEFYPTK